MPTTLRHDAQYLGEMMDTMIRIAPKMIEDSVLVTDVRDYFLWLTSDAIGDRELALELVGTFEQIDGKLDGDSWIWPSTMWFLQGFLFGLAQLLSIVHQITMLPQEKISFADFRGSFETTRRKLGLQE